MDLRERLARLDRSAGLGKAGPAADAAVHTFPEHLEMERRDGVAGEVWVHEETRAVARPEPDPTVLAGALTRPVPDGLDWKDVLFLDTETTGLAGGTGTIAFLVGVAWWEGDGDLRLRQYMIPGPGAEPAMLGDLAAHAAGFRLLATFNGHSYDLPLLRTRGILSRYRDLLSGCETWDLLPLGRRLWGRRLPDCRQGTLEDVVLGRERDGEDIPGARIPQTWIDFVREGDATHLGTVLHHNAWDLDGMAGILGRAAAACAAARSGPTAAGADALCWQDRWSLARLAESWHRRDLETSWMRAAVAAAPLRPYQLELGQGPPPPFFADALRMIKRTAAWGEVADLIAAGLHLEPDSPSLHREAAILYEHRLVDLRRALGHAQLSGEPERVERLERKLVAWDVAPRLVQG